MNWPTMPPVRASGSRRRIFRVSSTLIAAALFSVSGTRGATTKDPIGLTLPARCYAVPGVPVGIYHDNIVLAEKPEAYEWDFSCDIGASEQRRWAVTPSARDVGEHALRVTIRGGGAQIASGQLMVHVSPANAGEGRDLRLLIIGDSLTAATAYPNEIARLLSAPGNPKWTMLGTHVPSGAKPGVAHEGYGGWTWDSFLSRYDPGLGHRLDESGKRRSSPFLYPSERGSPTLDIARYLRENCQNRPPDVALILLGINDCFAVNPDDGKAIDQRIDIVLGNAEKFLSAFRAAAPKTVFGIGLTTPPNARESGFEANYKGRYHRWGWKRIQHQLVRRMIEHFDGRRAEGIHVVPTELNLDPVDGYPENNGVHPNRAGYSQIGASFYFWLMWWLATECR